ncbi:MAG: hypothetical protein E4H36_08670 [Spirochaetales bacterium]|nr:MAG: hypothetical protein E4H36_08670 [Spirochaetales bacterium]
MGGGVMRKVIFAGITVAVVFLLMTCSIDSAFIDSLRSKINADLGIVDDATGEISDAVAVTGVSLNKNAAELFAYNTEQLTATITPAEATNQNLIWSTSDAAKATVSESGLVRAVGGGSAAITVTTADGGFTDTCTVTITGAGDNLPYTAGGIPFKMKYVPGRTFPTGTDDLGGEATVSSFWMGETEVTNALMVAVMDWAYNNGKFSDTVADPNGIDGSTAKYGTQQLLDLDALYIKIAYSAGNFSCDSGYEEYPVINVTWYGAVMFCNWLTEMVYGNANEAAYQWVDNGDGSGTASDGIWQDDETDEDLSKTGFRLPSSNEWELAARFRTDAVNTVSGYSDPWFTKGNSLSGATTFYNDSSAGAGEPGKSANAAVAVYGKYWDGDSWEPTGETATVVKSKAANSLGIYDMSGNLWEFVFTENGNFRILRGGTDSSADFLQLGYASFQSPFGETDKIGFRIGRTAE